MTVVFDTNVYISFIRDLSHSAELLRRGTRKYLSAVVLMELWAGATARRGERLVHRLQKPYAAANRIISLRPSQYIAIGQFFADLPGQYEGLKRKSGFMNDVQIAFTAVHLGAVLFTEDRQHFDIIGRRLPQLQVRYLAA